MFVYEVHQLALNADQNPTHAISGSVETPAQIRSMFDDISYSKAGAVLRMLQYTVTEDNFKKALNQYLTNNEWAQAIFKRVYTNIEYLYLGSKRLLPKSCGVRSKTFSTTSNLI